jgi:hypothetical protein
VSVTRTLARLVVFTGTFVLCFLAFLLGASFIELTPGEIPRGANPLFLVIALGVPGSIAVWLDRRLRRRWRLPSGTTRTPRQRAALRAIAVAYLLTGVFGVPAVISQQNAWAVSEYKRLRASGAPTVWDAHPYIWAYGAVPVLPGVVLSYHEYQVGGVYGLGTFELAVWYGVGTKSLGELPIWVS